MYFSVTNARLIRFTITDPDVIKTIVKRVLNFLPIIKNDGRIKKIIIYHAGVSMKKFVLTALASTEVASRADKNNPIENKNKNILPITLDKPNVNISVILYFFL